jgi:hypothetical protein
VIKFGGMQLRKYHFSFQGSYFSNHEQFMDCTLVLNETLREKSTILA